MEAAVGCLFYRCPVGAMGWGLTEGQWPQLAMEGPVMNVQRQSRTLQQKHHQFSNSITARLGGTVLWNVSLDTVLVHMCTYKCHCVKGSLCVHFATHMGEGVTGLQLSLGCGK